MSHIALSEHKNWWTWRFLKLTQQKTTVFPKISVVQKKNTHVLSKIGYLESLAQPVSVRNVSIAVLKKDIFLVKIKNAFKRKPLRCPMKPHIPLYSFMQNVLIVKILFFFSTQMIKMLWNNICCKMFFNGKI